MRETCSSHVWHHSPLTAVLQSRVALSRLLPKISTTLNFISIFCCRTEEWRSAIMAGNSENGADSGSPRRCAHLLKVEGSGAELGLESALFRLQREFWSERASFYRSRSCLNASEEVRWAWEREMWRQLNCFRKICFWMQKGPKSNHSSGSLISSDVFLTWKLYLPIQMPTFVIKRPLILVDIFEYHISNCSQNLQLLSFFNYFSLGLITFKWLFFSIFESLQSLFY